MSSANQQYEMNSLTIYLEKLICPLRRRVSSQLTADIGRGECKEYESCFSDSRRAETRPGISPLVSQLLTARHPSDICLYPEK